MTDLPAIEELRQDIEDALNDEFGSWRQGDALWRDDFPRAVNTLLDAMRPLLEENERLRRAKAENDERFQVALVDARREVEALRAGVGYRQVGWLAPNAVGIHHDLRHLSGSDVLHDRCVPVYVKEEQE